MSSGYQPPDNSTNPMQTRIGPPTGTMHYLCAECGVKVSINKGEPIRCKECGHRVLYKQRTKRLVQFEAR